MIGQKAATYNPQTIEWKFTINTEATAVGEKKTGIPFNLYECDGASLDVEWGDGTTSHLIPSSYAVDNSTASVHEYANPGTYQISIKSGKWKYVNVLSIESNNAITSINNGVAPLYWWRRTLISFDNALPSFKNKYYYSSSTSISSLYTSPTSTSLSYFACKCTKLRSISVNLFDNCGNIEDFSYCFSGCSSLQSIPAGLFNCAVNATTFSNCFYQCTSLYTVPAGTFDHNTKVTSFYYLFNGCVSFGLIPAGLFDYNTEVTTFRDCFCGCEKVSSIPAHLFDNNLKVTTFEYTFKNCQELVSVPRGLFINNTEATTFAECFSMTPKLKNFKLIIGSAKVSSFSNFVTNASNVVRTVCVPAGSTTYTRLNSYKSSSNGIVVSTINASCMEALIYTVNTQATTAGAKTTQIPIEIINNSSTEKLYIDWGDGNGAEVLPSAFSSSQTHTYSSAGIYQITVGAMDWQDFVISANTSASGTFKETVVSIDDILPPAANTSLNNLFHSCTHLQSVSSGLFDNFTNVTEASAAFKNCSSLQEIPANLLKFNTALTNASSMFEGCTSLTYIPSGLLSQCRSLTNVSSMFKGCTGLTYYPCTLLLNNTAVSNQSNMFSGCSNSNPPMYTKAQLENNGYFVELYDSEATTEGGTTIGIPFNLKNNTSTLTVDWGDSSSSTLSSSNYTSTDSRASLHTYTNLGMYFVTVQSTSWLQTDILVYTQGSTISTPSNINAPIYWRKLTLIEVPVRLPAWSGKTANSYSNLGTTSNSARYLYCGCTALKSIPFNLFDSNTALQDFYAVFSACTSLASIPSSLLANASAAKDFGCIFSQCSSLQSIPAGLLDNNTAVTNFYFAFNGCSSITSIPAGLFANNTAARSFSTCFSLCTSLASIPSELFSYNTAATNFDYCFRGCSSITSIPAGLFANNTAVTTFNNCFTDCSSLAYIPAELFANNTAATNFSYCFQKCIVIQSIPSGLFASNTAAANFSYCFSYCDKLASIPSGLFASNTAATNFSCCFRDCIKIASIPSGLFASNTAATNFSYCFYNCTSLASISSGLFDSNTAATTFDNCFRLCTKLASIPSGLFDSNTAVTDFSQCFYGCSSLQSIPSGLFDSNTAVTNFSYCFRECTSLQSIPASLFLKNINVTDFYGCFYNCYNQNNFYTTIGSENVSNFDIFGKNITVCVPANSLTYDTISAYASSVPNNNIQFQNIGCYKEFSYTINTSATTANAVLGEIPFQVADSSIESELVIDWGDNTAVTATTADFASKSTHTYASPGTYQITIAGRGWNAYSFKCNTNSTDTFKKTVISIDDPIPDLTNSSLDNMFCYCSHLESVHYDALKNFYAATSASQTFLGCSSLQTIPARLFSKLVNLQNATSMFEGCTSITSIPSGLLANCTSLTNVSKMFKGCTALAYYPNTLLVNNASLSNRTDMFAGCSNTNPTFYTKAQLESGGYFVEVYDTTLTEDGKIGIPFNLSNPSQSITLTVDWGDGTVNTLTSSSNGPSYIHQYSNPGMYFVSIQSTNWTNTWMHYAMGAINDKTSSMYYRQRCLVEAVTCVPNVKGTNAENSYEYMYNNCRNLKKIPSNLFSTCINATRFYQCFYQCISLQSLPAQLFYNNTAAASFSQCFGYCSSLTSIPANLFHSTVAAAFEYCFRNCIKLTSIDVTAFKNCTNMTTVMGMFTGCTALQTVPEDLFRYNTTITAMGGGYGLFEGCTSLNSIPENFFKYNTAVTTFRYCFGSCNSLGNFTIHIGSTVVSDCLYFISARSGVTRTVYVPSGSTTQTTFNAIASTYGLTVIGE